MIKQTLIAAFCIVALSSCAIRLPERNIKKPDKKQKNHITKVRECVDSFMTEHGVKIEEAFNICEKIYRR